MRLPEVADRLRVLAKELDCDELDSLADEIARRPSGQRAPKTSRKMTDEVRQEIIEVHKKNPNLSQAQIGLKVNVNPGRISETLKGKRR